VASVKDFGAAGNGVTDDTAAINEAIAAADVVTFPPGVYIYSNSVPSKSVRIVGAGMDASVIKWKAGAAESHLFGFTGAGLKIEFSDLTIDGNYSNQTDSTGYYASINCSGAGTELSLRRMRFKAGRILDVRVIGPQTASDYAYLNVSDCIFENGLPGTATRAAAFVQAQDNVICQWIKNRAKMVAPGTYGRAGFLLQRAGGSTGVGFGKVIATGNVFERVGRGTTDTLGCIDVYSGGDQIVISGNTGSDTLGRFVSVKSDSGDITISSNTSVRHTGDIPAIVLFGQTTSAPSNVNRNAAIAGNVIREVLNASAYGIYVDGDPSLTGAEFNTVILANNIIDQVAYRAIHAQYVRNLVIDGNVIDRSARGIYARNITGPLDIVSNRITACTNTAVYVATATATEAFIRANRFHDNASADIIIEACASFAVDQNISRGGATFLNTAGATAASSVVGNDVQDATTVWAKSGTYSTLTYDKNRTSANLAFATRALTIATDAVTAFLDWHYVDTEAAAATDDLSTINGGYEGRTLTLSAANSSRDVVLKDGVGNLRLVGDFTMNNSEDTITLLYRGGNWHEIGRSDIAA
jgi:hypothetical protein